MAPRRALLLAAALSWAASATAQPRTGAVPAVETVVPGQSGTSVTGALQPIGGVPSISLSVPSLAGGLTPVVAPALKPELSAPAVSLSVAKPAAIAPAKAAKPVKGVAAIKNSGGGALVLEEEPADLRTKKAVETVRETAKHWTGVEFSEDDDPDVGTFWAGVQRLNAGALDAAVKDARLGVVEGAIARTAWRLKSSSLRRGAERDEKGLTPEKLVERGTRFTGAYAQDLLELVAYVPGLKPELVTGGEALAYFADHGGAPGGYAVRPLRTGEGDRREGFVWLESAKDEAFFIEVAAHEGFHQGDLGYREGYRAFAAALGEKRGHALAVALLEGFTELRARETTDRLLVEASRGVDGVARRYARAVAKRWGGGAKGVQRRFDDRETHGYDPFVKLVEEIVSRPGGRAALEAFVSRGRVAPLEALLGYGTLETLGGIAAAANGPKTWGPAEHRLADSLGVAPWVRRRLVEAARGEAAPHETELAALVETVVGEAHAESARPGLGFEREHRARALNGLNLTAALEQRVPLEELLARVRSAAYVLPGFAFMPPAPFSFAAALSLGHKGMALIGYPAALLAALAYRAGAGQPLIFLAFMAGLLLAAQVVSGVMLARRPTYWLRWRWGARPRK